MFKYKKNRLILGVVGVGLVLFVKCSSSANEMSNKGQLYAPEQKTEQNKPIKITSEQFIKLVADYSKEWKYVGKKPCVVDFYADWCRPCRMMDPAFAKVSEKYAGKVNFYKINVDYNKDVSNAYQITGIPTLFFCSMDGKMTRIAGYLTEEQLITHIETMLSKKK